MNEYTFENLIINPETPGLENLIGKEVYFGDTPMECLHNANIDNRASLGILTEIREKFNFPFRIDRTINFNHLDNGDFVYEDWNFLCFIPKKEDPKPEFVPFKSVVEFLDGYSHVETKNLDNAHRYLYSQGMWLKGMVSGSYYMVAGICNNGVTLANDPYITSWGELLEDYVFLDNSSCGRLVEEKYE